MVITKASQRIRPLLGLTLSLCELVAHIPRWLEAYFMGKFSRISCSWLQSKLRYAA